MSKDKSRILKLTHMEDTPDYSKGAAKLGLSPRDGDHNALGVHRSSYHLGLNCTPGSGAPEQTADLGDSEATVENQCPTVFLFVFFLNSFIEL